MSLESIQLSKPIIIERVKPSDNQYTGRCVPSSLHSTPPSSANVSTHFIQPVDFYLLTQSQCSPLNQLQEAQRQQHARSNRPAAALSTSPFSSSTCTMPSASASASCHSRPIAAPADPVAVPPLTQFYGQQHVRHSLSSLQCLFLIPSASVRVNANSIQVDQQASSAVGGLRARRSYWLFSCSLEQFGCGYDLLVLQSSRCRFEHALPPSPLPMPTLTQL